MPIPNKLCLVLIRCACSYYAVPVPNYKKLCPFLISCTYLELDFDPDPALYWSVRLMKLVGGFTFTSSLACKFTLKKTCLHFQQSNFSHHCYHRCALMRKNLQESFHQNHHCFLQNTIKSFSYFYIQQPLPNHFLHNRVVIFLITTKLQLFSFDKLSQIQSHWVLWPKIHCWQIL